MSVIQNSPGVLRGFNEILEHLPVGLSVVNARLELVAWNSRFFSLLDFPDEFARYGTPFEEFIRYNAQRGEYGPGDPETQVAERMALAWRFEAHLLRRVRPDGSVIEVRGNPLPGGGFISTYTDISERESAVRDAQLSEDRYRRLVELTPDAVFVHRHGKVLLANEAALRLFGAPSVDELGHCSLLDLVAPVYRGLVADRIHMLEDPAAGPVSLPRTEQIYRRIDGTEVPVETTATRVVLNDGPAVMSVARDITDRRAEEALIQRLKHSLQERVRQRTAELTASMKDLEAFSYTISHDLRTPLRAVDGYSHLLQEEFGDLLGSTGADYLRRIRSASQRMGGLIDDLLDLVRIGRCELARQPVDLTAMADEIRRELMALSPTRHIDWRIGEGLSANADPALARMVLDSLLRNAWKFSSERDPATIEFLPSHDADKHGFCVRDNGVGFDMAHAQNLFKPFQRLHAGSRFEGVGIGLALVSRVVQRHGGRVWAEARPDEGAAFYFTFGNGESDLAGH